MWKIIVTKFMLTCGLNLYDYFNLTELVDKKKKENRIYIFNSKYQLFVINMRNLLLKTSFNFIKPTKRSKKFKFDRR